ncbi:MAG TPA: helix-turn-helix transcriptional regulator [Arachidicoccus sp.]|nr:helix-turn-helix transcriptional regulator [Arachidicoccus sp.]
MANNRFAENIKYLRKKSGKNQTECGIDLDLPRSTFSNYEKGDTEPVVGKLVEIAQYFGISIEHLLFKDFSNDDTSAKKEVNQPVTSELISPKTVIELQESTISILRNTIKDKNSIISMLRADNDRLKVELQERIQDR